MIAEMQATQTAKWPLHKDHPLLKYLLTIIKQHPVGLCTDIDGTISLTARTVDEAVILPGMRKILRQATKQFDLVATISGRSIESQKRLVRVGNMWHVGHHGYEWEERKSPRGRKRRVLYPGTETYIERVANALNDIENELAPMVPGLWMERKGITGGIHWRLASNQDEAEKICVPVIEHITDSYGLRYRGGKLGMEIYPPIVTDKGEGLRRLIEKHNLNSVIYLGDDISDTDAFRTVQELREQENLKGVAIGVMKEPHKDILETADLILSDPQEVKAFLEWLLNCMKE